VTDTTTSSPGRVDPLTDLLDSALGRTHRSDPVRPGTGGPAGNARLTAWFGLLLLVFFVVEGVTLISLGHLITLHILIGALLVPLVLVKTATTTWRIAHYYLGSVDYRSAGPPPLILRLLGPPVILTGVAVLGSGLALVALGNRSFDTLVTVGGVGVSPLTIHKAMFVLWLAVTGLHVLARTIPAVRSAGRSTPTGLVPGGLSRAVTVVVTLLVGVVVALVVVHLSGGWTHHQIGHDGVRRFGGQPFPDGAK
jgi:hypothetical protein